LRRRIVLAEAPNAMRLSKDQVTEALARLSPTAKAIAIALAKTDEERERIREQAVEVPWARVADEAFAAVSRRLEEAPPVRFDVARQVQVFNAYLQYVELKLTGAAIQRHRLAIPESIQKLGGSKDLEGRLRTTFDLIEKGGQLSSKALEDALNEIRKNFTPSLGKDHGRVVLKAAKPHLEERLAKFRDELKAHQEKVEKSCKGSLMNRASRSSTTSCRKWWRALPTRCAASFSSLAMPKRGHGLSANSTGCSREPRR
jgi:hypothetical protein